jgi:transposase-like protein
MRGVAYDPVFRAKLMAMHQEGVTLTALSREFGVAREVLSRWWSRYQAADLVGLQPHSRRPHLSPTILSERTQKRILALRARRLSAARIAHELQLGHGTVQRHLKRHGVNQLPRPARATPKRFEKQRPGELVHIDFKYLPALRNARHDFEFAAVDDFSREAVVWITTESTSAAATAFLERVSAALPYPIEAVLTDNAFAFTCGTPGMRRAGRGSKRPVPRWGSPITCSGRTLRSPTARSNASFAPLMTSVCTCGRSSHSRRAAELSMSSSGTTTMSDRTSASPA